MAMTVQELRDWLEGFKAEESLAIAEDGLRLVCVEEPRVWYEMGGIPLEDDPAIDDWDAPTCLRWLAAHTEGPNHFAARAADWDNEVSRYAAHEQIEMDEWERTATEELRAGIRERQREDVLRRYEV